MTTYQLCTKLGKILSRHIKLKLYHQGILRTVQQHNRTVMIDAKAVHTSLKESIEREKEKSAKTIAMLQEAIDLIETLPTRHVIAPDGEN